MNIFKIRKSNKEQIEAISEALSLSNKKYFFSTSIVFCKESKFGFISSTLKPKALKLEKNV